MKVGSLFAGIGGFDLGFERAGFDIRWQVEIDPFARQVLAKHWPATRRYEDVRDVGVDLEWVDVILGGFPCTDVSESGSKRGLAGPESSLWREQRRIIRVLRPRYVVVENVSGLFDRGFAEVLGDLAALGLDAEWALLSACAFGAPHPRDRVFIVAYADAARRAASGPRETQSRPATEPQPSGESRRAARWSPTWASEPGLPRVAHGVPAVMERGAGLGGAVLPQIAEWIARQILTAEGR